MQVEFHLSLRCQDQVVNDTRRVPLTLKWCWPNGTVHDQRHSDHVRLQTISHNCEEAGGPPIDLLWREAHNQHKTAKQNRMATIKAIDARSVSLTRYCRVRRSLTEQADPSNPIRTSHCRFMLCGKRASGKQRGCWCHYYRYGLPISLLFLCFNNQQTCGSRIKA